MPAANHSFYLRNFYLDNKLTKGELEIGGVRLDLRKVTMPVYNLATREDHIAPAKSVLYGSQFFGGPVKFVLAGSGHIAGVINPPGKPKYQYWTGAEPGGTDVDKWLAMAQRASRLLVAGLAGMAQSPGRHDRAGAHHRRRQAQSPSRTRRAPMSK